MEIVKHTNVAWNISLINFKPLIGKVEFIISGFRMFQICQNISYFMNSNISSINVNEWSYKDVITTSVIAYTYNCLRLFTLIKSYFCLKTQIILGIKFNEENLFIAHIFRNLCKILFKAIHIILVIFYFMLFFMFHDTNKKMY